MMTASKKGLKIALLANPHSGKGAYVRQGLDRRFQKLAQQINQTPERFGGNQVEIFVTESLTDINHVGTKLRQENFDIIALYGGDGAIQKTLTRLWSSFPDGLPPVLLLRGGTMNNVARSFGARGAPLKRLLHFAQNARRENLIYFRRKTMDVNGELGFMYGLGLANNFIEMYNRGGNAGPVKAFQMIFIVLAAALFHKRWRRELFTPLSGHLEVDEQKSDLAHVQALLAQTIPNLAIGFRITYRALEAFDQGKTAHAIATDRSPLRLVKYFFHILFQRPFHGRGIVNDLVSTIDFYPTEPCRYMIDGDIFNHSHYQKPISMAEGPEIPFVWYEA